MPALCADTKHSGDVMVIGDDELDDLVERWHAGEWPNETLELVVRLATGWDFWQFARWVAHGQPD